MRDTWCAVRCRRGVRAPQLLAGIRARVVQVTAEIIQARKDRNQAETFDWKLLQSMLRVWSAVKDLRKTQGYTSFPLALKLYQQETEAQLAAKLVAETVEIEADIDTEVEELHNQVCESGAAEPGARVRRGVSFAVGSRGSARSRSGSCFPLLMWKLAMVQPPKADLAVGRRSVHWGRCRPEGG